METPWQVAFKALSEFYLDDMYPRGYTACNGYSQNREVLKMARWPNRYSGKGPRNGQDRKTRHGKPCRCKSRRREGVSELQIHYGPGYRVYYKQRGSELVILLAGGDKGSQSRDIKIALRLAKNLPDSFLS